MMVKIIFVDHLGLAQAVDVAPGLSLMTGAVRGGVVAIEGECGGALACATCHIYVPEAWRAVTGEASADERGMLECANDVDDRSRLGCQVIVTDQMDGLTIHTPASQR
jgi:2Fe-2S ferredoxin